MNPFPRIHSLGTINIIHHQEFFYEFHPFRTDFVGDSGVGKSIITDLLQLILVGSSHYSSSTQSKDDRPFNTLVLKNNDSSDFGYAFINVEMELGKYVVLGTYLTINQNQSQAFIIQNSLNFDEEKLEPLNKPIGIDSFEKEGDWLPIDELDIYFNDEKDIGFKKFRRFQKYHETLNFNGLLPIDVNSSNSLKDYALILQTFARKNINIKEGVQLKDFLFGKQWHNHFYKVYEGLVTDMQEDIDTYRTNREDLDRIEEKKTALQNLFKLKFEVDDSLLSWQRINYVYLIEKKRELEVELRKKVKRYLSSLYSLKYLIHLRKDKIQDLDNSLPTIKSRQKSFDEDYHKVRAKVRSVESLDDFKTHRKLETIEEIIEYFKTFNTNRELCEILQTGIDKLKEMGLLEPFSSLNHEMGLSRVFEELNDRLSENRDELKTYEVLLDCNDIDNPNSLVYWILRNKSKLTPEQEAIVMYFQNSHVQLKHSGSFKAGDRYIPSPEVILNTEFLKNEEGFWVDFGGVHTFFEYRDQQLFDGQNEKEIADRFNENRELLKTKVEELKNELRIDKELIGFFQSESNIQGLFEAWLVKDKLEYTPEDLDHPILSLNKEEFMAAVQTYRKKEEVHSQWERIEHEHNQLITKVDRETQLREKLEGLSISEPGAISQLIEEIMGLLKIDNQNPKVDIEIDETQYFADFKEAYNNAQLGANNINDINDCYQRFNSIVSQIDEIELSINKDAIANEPTNISKDQVELASKRYEDAEREYDKAYHVLIGNSNIVENDRKMLATNKDFKVLVSTIMPEIFRKVNFEESEVVQKISDYLDEINRKNAEITKNKLIHIRYLLQDLNAEVAQQTNIARQVRNELNRSEAEISGDLRATLNIDQNTRMKVQWISDFLDKMPTINEGLFDPANQAYFNEEEQRGAVSIEDHILAGYRKYTEHPLPHATIQDLLSPFSYYDLDYSIRTASDFRNSGSTGQTYASMALLCIAKISMIQKDQKSKNLGLRFMSIDEAAGIGSNFEMLKRIAKKYKYQILSLSIPLNQISEGEQHIYRLYTMKNQEYVNHHPVAILSTEI